MAVKISSKKISLYFVLSPVFLLVWFRLVDLGQLGSFFRQVDLFALGGVFLAIIANDLLAAYRLKLLAKPISQASIGFYWAVNFLGVATSLIIPFQGGGFLRAYLLKKKFRARFSTCFAIILVEFIINLGVLFLFSFLAISFLVGEAAFSSLVYWLLGLLLLVVLFLFLKTPWVEKKIKGFPKIASARDSFRLGFSLLAQDYLLLVWFSVLSVVGFLLIGLRVFWLFQAFGVKAEYFSVLLAQALFSLSNFIPGAPIKIGQYELFGLVAYSLFLDFSPNLIASVVLLSHLIAISYYFLGGCFASLSLGIKPQKLIK